MIKNPAYGQLRRVALIDYQLKKVKIWDFRNIIFECEVSLLAMAQVKLGEGAVEKFILYNFLWSITPLFEHTLLYMHYEMC